MNNNIIYAIFEIPDRVDYTLKEIKQLSLKEASTEFNFDFNIPRVFSDRLHLMEVKEPIAFMYDGFVHYLQLMQFEYKYSYPDSDKDISTYLIYLNHSSDKMNTHSFEYCLNDSDKNSFKILDRINEYYDYLVSLFQKNKISSWSNHIKGFINIDDIFHFRDEYFKLDIVDNNKSRDLKTYYNDKDHPIYESILNNMYRIFLDIDYSSIKICRNLSNIYTYKWQDKFQDYIIDLERER